MSPASRPLLAALAAAGALCCACSVGPDYEREEPPTPSAFAAAASSAPITSAEPRLRWWTRFGDPLLSELVERAVAQNLDVALARARLRRVRALRSATARGLFLPRGGVNAGYERFRLSEQGAGAAAGAVQNGLVQREDDHVSGTFDASWELDVFGGSRRALEGAQARLEAELAARDGVVLATIAEVCRAYFQLRGAEGRLVATRDSLALARRSQALLETREREGRASRLAVSRARAEAEREAAELPRLRAARAVALRQLQLLLAAEAGWLEEQLAAPRSPLAPERVGVGLPARLLARRPDLRLAERELAAQVADVGVETADLYPRFVLIGSAGFDSAKLADLFSQGSFLASIAPSVRWELLSIPKNLAELEQEEAEVAIAALRFRHTLLRALAECNASIRRYAEGTREVALREGLVETAQETVRLAQLRFRVGTSGLEPLLDTQRALASAKRRLVTSREGLLIEAAFLYKALGGGWEAFPLPAEDQPAEDQPAEDQPDEEGEPSGD